MGEFGVWDKTGSPSGVDLKDESEEGQAESDDPVSEVETEGKIEVITQVDEELRMKQYREWPSTFSRIARKRYSASV
jgi:hypothetical protein